MTTPLLDPARHRESVRHFRAHFHLAVAPPSRAYLRELLGHFGNLPYENLSKIIKFNRYGGDFEKRLRLPEEVMQDHARWRLGGTCFSLTFFLHTILWHSGFASYIVMADMRAGPNLHCALIVFVDGIKYLVDPGYVLRVPMALDPARPRLYYNDFTGVELRLLPPAAGYDLFTFNRQEVKWRYRFDDRPTPLPEFLAHWQASFHRNSMHGLCLTRVQDDELIFIHKEHLRITSMTGKRNVNLKRNYHAVIHELFGIAPELVEQARAALQANLQRERETGIFLPSQQ
ncbi:MAG: arylamine N-acetyltransferase [candidate division KSB1 bacterium]|nr:arylamine N-acetyltransferase [candidate division KSB1 bacterium]MDZ7273507.1 arylamine N-acetyltransferase [candidate division KSB1 bacterium]MDZ7286902.1 arylamine N-acetyltransferase [candidate division KSB1 bacterium]MDZ7299745.1 arylamine N-acetyltransferase [candidate division KSB1 bacterium]MDZ7305684.1 arylamine N-acetyltransferase [candidate division KSB1 bacterium]